MMVIGVAEGSKASFRAGVKYEIHHTLGNGPVERTLIKVLIFGLGEHNGHIPMFAQMEHDEFEFFFSGRNIILLYGNLNLGQEHSWQLG
ncbi:unnamed protein product [Rhodiola kirilowii]